ncbi:MAG: hypothetical protein JHC33_11920 [Ignisphaera sp.]|nr:hypothetical protein [Ignisphaera sp.]
MKIVYILHVPSGEMYPVEVSETEPWYKFTKLDVIDAIQIAQAEEHTSITIPWGKVNIYFTSKFDAYLFKCNPPNEISEYTLRMPITVLSDEFELIDSINIKKTGVL